ncbi:calcium-activated potassium channel subunit alpha-1-like [Ambystoma mexicanum]|uniref:calcium-activated potassium channel subunit alpha-1-like n=1 Tax=Ambystoma mexicanum TaxID=8296 RepID=UPI0037E8E18F
MDGILAYSSEHCHQELLKFYLLSSATIYLGGLILIVIWRIVKEFINCCRPFSRKNYRLLWMNQKWDGTSKYFYTTTKVQYWAQMILSAKNATGRFLTLLMFVLSLVALAVYFAICLRLDTFCITSNHPMLHIDLVLNAVFLFYFGLRFLAAEDILRFWLELKSIVDFFTIPPACVAYFLKRNTIGFRFLRALGLLDLPNILQFLDLIKERNSLRLAYMLAVFLSMWLTASGAFHLIENSGDPWLSLEESNAQVLSYLECIYFTLVTMGTIGFGDVSTRTILGHIFLIFFIIGGLALYARFVPEIMLIIGSYKEYYSRAYSLVRSKKHVVICGHISVESVCDFLDDFSFKNSGKINTDILFLEQIVPSLELEGAFKLNNIYATFFYGTVLNYKDLIRVQMESADACIVLADKYSSSPDEEDKANVMRVLSVKNRFPRTRVIIQMCQAHNKAHVQNLPSWNWQQGDCIVCFAELKLGFTAQSCLVPGISTILSNLFITKDKVPPRGSNWRQLYQDGMDNSVMTSYLSRDFEGKSFTEAALLCSSKLHILLLAIEYRSATENNSSILINPPADVRIKEYTMGFFIAKTRVEVRRAGFYCHACHADITIPHLIQRCNCITQVRKSSYSESESAPVTSPLLPLCPMRSRSLGILPKSEYPEKYGSKDLKESAETILDSTGLFHLCTPVPLEKAILSRKTVASLNLQNHIIVGVFGNENSTLTGLRNFVMPLRASNFTYEELKYIVFVGSLEYMEREWQFIHNFPKLGVLPGSVLSRSDLRAANLDQCSMCAIISSNYSMQNYLVVEDADCILATLNIRSMQLKKLPEQDPQTSGGKQTDLSQKHYQKIPVITDLKHAFNVKFLDVSSSATKSPKQKLHNSWLFASGSVFCGSFLDSLMTTSYHNHHILALLQALVTGGTTPDLEEQLAEENKLIKHSTKSLFIAERDRCKLSYLPITETLVEDVSKLNFGQVFAKALGTFGILCFGVYRLFEEPNPLNFRYVISKPPNDFMLLPTDLLFAAVPFKGRPCREMSPAEASTSKKHHEALAEDKSVKEKKKD